MMDEGKGLDVFVSWYERCPNDVVDLLSRFAKEINEHFSFNVELPPKSDEAKEFHESTWVSSVVHCQIPVWFERLFSLSPEIKERLVIDDECKQLFDNHWFRDENG